MLPLRGEHAFRPVTATAVRPGGHAPGDLPTARSRRRFAETCLAVPLAARTLRDIVTCRRPSRLRRRWQIGSRWPKRTRLRPRRDPRTAECSLRVTISRGCLFIGVTGMKPGWIELTLSCGRQFGRAADLAAPRTAHLEARRDPMMAPRRPSLARALMMEPPPAAFIARRRHLDAWNVPLRLNVDDRVPLG